MKTLETKIITTLLVLGFSLFSLDVSANSGQRNYITEDYSNEMTVLNPGWRSSCHTNFVIENMDENEAEIQIRLGWEIYKEDNIMGNSKRLYDLRESLSFAKQLGKTVTMDDVALVTNQSENSSVRIHC